jgi:hypothetical protein
VIDRGRIRIVGAGVQRILSKQPVEGTNANPNTTRCGIGLNAFAMNFRSVDWHVSFLR